MPTVHFVSEELQVDVDEGMGFLELAEEVDCDITFGCRSGSCGTCRIRVLDGASNLSQPSREEKDFLEGFGAHADERLACQCKIEGDCKIRYVGLDDLDE